MRGLVGEGVGVEGRMVEDGDEGEGDSGRRNGEERGECNDRRGGVNVDAIA